MNKLLILSFLVIQGCAPLTYNVGPYEVRQCGPTFYTYAPDTDEQQREEIRAAFNYFNEVLQRKLWIDGGADTDSEPNEAISRIVFVPELPPNGQNIVCGKTAVTIMASGCIVNVLMQLSEECAQANTVPAWQTKLRHEVGHASGLLIHNEDPAGLMYPSSPSIGDTARELSDEEREALISLYP